MTAAVQKFAGLSELSPSLRALLDTERAIPSDVVFLPGRPRTSSDLVLWGVLGGGGAVAGLVGLAFLVDDFRRGPHTVTSTNAGSSYLATAVVGGLLAGGSVWGALEDLQRMREQSSGVPNRYGLYLAPEALLERLGRNSCTVLPRERVTGAEVVEEKKEQGAVTRSHVSYTDEKGQAQQLSIGESLAGDPAAHAAVVEAVRAWLARSRP